MPPPAGSIRRAGRCSPRSPGWPAGCRRSWSPARARWSSSGASRDSSTCRPMRRLSGLAKPRLGRAFATAWPCGSRISGLSITSTTIRCAVTVPSLPARPHPAVDLSPSGTSGYAGVVEITMRLALPREGKSVPVVRRILKHAPRGGVRRGPGDQRHRAGSHRGLHQRARPRRRHRGVRGRGRLDGACCRIEVIDRGVGYDDDRRDPDRPTARRRGRRGLFLMRAVSDKVEVVKGAAEGPSSGSRSTSHGGTAS